MDFELELGELRPLFGRDEGFKDIPPFNHILCNGEIYRSVYDKDCGTIWICITDDKKEDMYGYNYDSKNPFMVQVITYKRTKEKVIVPKEPIKLEDKFGEFDVITRHTNYPVTGKNQICKSEIFKNSTNTIYLTIKSSGITVKQAHENSRMIAKHLDKTISYK